MIDCTSAIFPLMRESKNVNNIFDSLEALQPNNLSINKIVEIVQYLERLHSYDYGYEHYNSFGTGGDKVKTINISTISSIVASNHFIPMIKVGTSKVTSNVGSVNFISNILKSQNKLIKRYVNNKNFKYLSLNDIGLGYSEYLIEARKRLYDNNMLDIFKVVFPLTNLTGSYGQVNGISDIRYLSYFVDSSLKLNRNSILVHSEQGVDEIYTGNNLLIEINEGKFKEYYIETEKIASNFMNEVTCPTSQEEKLISILTQACDVNSYNIILFNVAAIVKLKYPNKNFTDVINLVKKGLFKI